MEGTNGPDPLAMVAATLTEMVTVGTVAAEAAVVTRVATATAVAAVATAMAAVPTAAMAALCYVTSSALGRLPSVNNTDG